MEKSEVMEAFKQARNLVGDIEERFKSAAFQVLFQRLLDRGTSDTAPALERSPRVVPAMRMNEFLASKGIRSHNDRVLAIAYYYISRGEPITSAVVEQAYRESRQPRPTNLSDVIAKLVRKGLLVDSLDKKDNRKAWQITPSGEQYVQEKLSS